MQKIIKIITLISIILFYHYNLHSQETKEHSELKLALNLYNDGMYELAMEQFKNFTTSYPLSNQVPEAKFYIGLCLLNLKKYDDAKLAFQNFALSYSEHPKAPEAWYKVGEIDVKLNNFHEAAVSFERARTFYPRSQIAPEALFMAAKYYKISGDILKARKSINIIIQEYNNSEFLQPARLALAEILMNEGNFDLAISETRKVFDTSEKFRPDAMLLLARIYKETYQYSEAEKLLNQLIQGYKNNQITIDANLNLGLIYKKNKNFSEAINQFNNLITNKAIEANKREFILYELAKTYFDIKDFKNALEILKKLIKEFPDTRYKTEALYLSGYCSENLKDFRSALSYYDEIISLNIPDDYSARAYYRGSLTAEQIGNIHLAISYCENYISNSNLHKQDAYIRIANLYRYYLRDFIKAKEFYEIALKYTTKSHNLTKILYNTAECKELYGDYISALENYNYILKNFPSTDEAHNAKSKIEYINNYKIKNYENATLKLAKLFSKIIDESSPALYHELAEIYFYDLKDYLLAAENFAKASTTQITSEFKADMLYKKSISYDRHSYIDTTYRDIAINSYKEFINNYPNHNFVDSAIINLIKLYYLSNKLNEIESLINKHFTTKFKNPNYIHAIDFLIDLYINNNRKIEAIQLLKAAIFQTEQKVPESIYWKISQLYLMEGQHDSTSTYLKKQLELFPNGAYTFKAILTMANIYYDTKKYSEAAKWFKKLEDEYYFIELPAGFEVKYVKSIIESENYIESIALIQRLINYNKNNPFVDKDTLIYNFYLATIYYKIKDLQNAMRNLKEFISQSDDNELISEAYLMLAEIAKIQGMADAATAYYKAAGTLGNQKAKRDIADLLYKQSRYNDAISQYESLLTNSNNSDEKQYYLAQIILSKLKSNEIKSAQEKINEFKKLYPKDKKFLAEFEYERAMAYFRNKDYNNAKKTFQNVSSEFEGTIYKSLSEFYLGKILEINQQIQDAIKKYQSILTKFPKTEAAYRSLLALGNIYFNSEKFEDAIKYYQEIVNDGEKSGEILQYALTNLIEAYESLKLYEGALKITRDYISSYPYDKTIPDKKIKLGILYTRLGYYDQAILQYQTLLDELEPDYESELRYNLGETYFLKGDYQQAILEFLKIPYIVTAKQEIDWTATALYMAGQSYEKLGKYDQAISIYQQIIDKKGIDTKFKAGAQKEIDRVKSLIKKGE